MNTQQKPKITLSKYIMNAQTPLGNKAVDKLMEEYEKNVKAFNKMAKRDYVQHFFMDLNTEIIREINQGIIPESTTKKQIGEIIAEKVKNKLVKITS